MALSIADLQEHLLKVYPLLEKHTEMISFRCMKHQVNPAYATAVSTRLMMVSDILDNRIGEPALKNIQSVYEQGAVALIDLNAMLQRVGGADKKTVRNQIKILRAFYRESGFVKDHPDYPGYPVHPHPVELHILDLV